MAEGGAGGAWGWLGKARAAVAQAGSAAAAHAAKMKTLEDDDPSAPAAADSVPWEAPPSQWVGRERCWAELVQGVVGDDGTFLFGPERGMTKDEGRALRDQGVVVDFLYEEDHMSLLNARLLEFKPLADARFRLVPRWMGEECFWQNYFWKVRELGKVEDAQVQARLLLGVVNAPRPDLPAGEEREEREEGERHAQRHCDIAALYDEADEALRLLRDCLDAPGSNRIDAAVAEHDARAAAGAAPPPA
eukprot:gene24598-46142_t